MRHLVWATLINTFGNGLTTTAATLYAVRVVHVSNGQLGTGLAVAAVIALVVGIGLGHLADIVGTREVLVGLTALQGLLSFVYAFTRTYWLFLFAIIGLAVGYQGVANVRGAIVAQITNPETRIRERAFLRAVTNLGVGVGGVVAGIAISIDTPKAYSTILVIDGVTFLASIPFLMKLPRIRRSKDGEHARITEALRHWPYVTASVLTGIVAMHYSMLTLAVPLWVVQQTHAPRWVVAAALITNTVMVVLFQVRASKGTDSPESSARVVRTSTVLLASACLIYWTAHGRTAWLAATLVLTGALVHVIGELRQSSGTWGMGYGLTPHEAHGQYQAVWQSSFTLANLIGPPFMAGFVVTHGLAGWATFAAIYLAAGALMPVITRVTLERNEMMSHAVRASAG